MASITLHDVEYPLATTLRVAYVVQNQHNHKAYTEIFSNIGDMTLESQIDILYAAFQVGNSETAKTFTKEMFRFALLDNPEFTVSKIMGLLSEVLSGIMGKDLDTSENGDSAAREDSSKN